MPQNLMEVGNVVIGQQKRFLKSEPDDPITVNTSLIGITILIIAVTYLVA